MNNDFEKMTKEEKDKWLYFDFSTYPTYENRIWQALTDGETFYQCTGLKDKNGKLIYEGDIVKINDEVLVVRYHEEMACLAPQYYSKEEKGYGGRLGFDEYDSEECGFYKSTTFEIIGNTYENKELLLK